MIFFDFLGSFLSFLQMFVDAQYKEDFKVNIPILCLSLATMFFNTIFVL